MMNSLQIQVLNYEDEPMENKTVFLNFQDSFIGMVDTHTQDSTDSDGYVYFSDIPIGTIDIIVDGTTQKTISLGQNDDEEITIYV